jgi:hybrid cluster-associated redox disulfide protein
MSEMELSADLTIADVQDQWPQTITVFRDFAAACVGCDLASFCTISDAAKEYQIPLEQLLADLQAAIEP